MLFPRLGWEAPAAAGNLKACLHRGGQPPAPLSCCFHRFPSVISWSFIYIQNCEVIKPKFCTVSFLTPLCVRGCLCCFDLYFGVHFFPSCFRSYCYGCSVFVCLIAVLYFAQISSLPLSFFLLFCFVIRSSSCSPAVRLFVFLSLQLHRRKIHRKPLPCVN